MTKLFWSYNDIPEFKELSANDRKAAWKSIYSEVRKNVRVKVATGFSIGIIFLTIGIGLSSAHSILGWNKIFTAACFGGLGGAVAGVIMQSSVRRNMQPYIDRYFNKD